MVPIIAASLAARDDVGVSMAFGGDRIAHHFFRARRRILSALPMDEGDDRESDEKGKVFEILYTLRGRSGGLNKGDCRGAGGGLATARH